MKVHQLYLLSASWRTVNFSSSNNLKLTNQQIISNISYFHPSLRTEGDEGLI